MSGSNPKAIIQKTPAETVEHQVRFETQRFDSLVFDKGYEVWIDRAFKCPCSVKGTGQPLVDCRNCLGKGWVFTNRIETRIALQTIRADIRYDNWTQNTAGTARVTARAIDKLAFMDRIILQDVEGYYNEILRSRAHTAGVSGVYLDLYTNYGIIEIEEIMVFVDSTTALTYLKEGVDYQLNPDNDTNIQIINQTYENESLTLTIRYKHFMTYHIIDMNRDITKVREKNCSYPEETLKNMPIAGMARKAHFLFDNLKYEESQNLIDNTKS